MSQQQAKVKGVADIVFLVDTTGSMKPCIDQLKKSIAQFCQKLSSGNQAVDWRARVVGFRDREADGSQWIVGTDHTFVSTASELEDQLNVLSAEGGGDDPESGLDALWVVAHDTQWRQLGYAHRVIVVLTDQPPKNPMHPATVPSGQANDVLAVCEYLATNRIKVLVWAPYCEEWDLVGKIPRSQFNDVAKDTDTYEGLRNVQFPEVYETIARTVSTPLS